MLDEAARLLVRFWKVSLPTDGQCTLHCEQVGGSTRTQGLQGPPGLGPAATPGAIAGLPGACLSSATSSPAAIGWPGCSTEETAAWWPKADERKDELWAWLGSSMGSPGWARVGACVLEDGKRKSKSASQGGRGYVWVLDTDLDFW